MRCHYSPSSSFVGDRIEGSGLHSEKKCSFPHRSFFILFFYFYFLIFFWTRLFFEHAFVPSLTSLLSLRVFCSWAIFVPVCGSLSHVLLPLFLSAFCSEPSVQEHSSSLLVWACPVRFCLYFFTSAFFLPPTSLLSLSLVCSRWGWVHNVGCVKKKKTPSSWGNFQHSLLPSFYAPKATMEGHAPLPYTQAFTRTVPHCAMPTRSAIPRRPWRTPSIMNMHVRMDIVSCSEGNLIGLMG